jgi:uncharacterized FlaG/YvyC family protein
MAGCRFTVAFYQGAASPGALPKRHRTHKAIDMASDIQPAVSTGPASLEPIQGTGAAERARATKELLDAPKDGALPSVVARQAQPLARNTEFVKDPGSGKMLLRILSPTGEVIRQLPSEEALQLSRLVGRLNGNFLTVKA